MAHMKWLRSWLVASILAPAGLAHAAEPAKTTGNKVDPAPVPAPAQAQAQAQAQGAGVVKTPAPSSKAMTPPETEAAPAGAPKFQIGGGILGGGGIVAIEKPGDNPSGIRGSASNPQSLEPYPGYFGPKVGGGISIEARLFGAVGLEFDLLRLTETGNADLNGAKISIEQTTWHIPIYLKGILPFGAVRPFIGLGPELVLGGISNYTLFGGMIGAEGHIPIGKKLTLTIPVSLRYAYNFGLGDKYADRYTSILGFAVPKPEFQHNALLTLGVSLHFTAL
jgi:hypothetical protein